MQLPPLHLGAGVRGRCEAAAHAVRAFVKSPVLPEINALVKLDLKSAFISVRRDNFLDVYSSIAPSILRLALTAYATSRLRGRITYRHCRQPKLPNFLYSSSTTSWRLMRRANNDNNEVARSIRSPINIWYFYDATIGGPVKSICEDLRRIIPILSDIGLEVNPSMSEASNVSCDNFQIVMIAIQSALSGVTVTMREDLSILRAPVDINVCRTGVLNAVGRLSTSGRLESIDAKPASFLIWNCLSMPHLLFMLEAHRSTVYTQN